MKNSRYKVIVLIGQGQIAGNVFKYLLDCKDKYRFRLECIVHEDVEKNILLHKCPKSGIKHFVIPDKQNLNCFWLERYNEKTLIISAFNNYWFPKSMIDCDWFTIINFHNSFLPHYQGGNAIAWQIFNEEKYAGATWHYVTSKADAGDVIWQQRFEISKEAKAYEVSRECMAEGYMGFCEFVEKLLVENIEGIPQVYPDGKRQMHLFSELPMNGVFETTDNAKDIYKLLRAMDYGWGSKWKKPQLKLGVGKMAEVVRYSIVDYESDKICFQDNLYYYIKLDERQYIRLTIKEV